MTARYVPSIDIYLTYRCNMRCMHCFVGDALNASTDFDRASLDRLISVAAQLWATRELTFLGGEPTLYPQFADVIKTGQDNGYKIRLVSNGAPSLRRLLTNNNFERLTVTVSIDASESAAHDKIRSRGSFRSLIESLTVARDLGHTTAAILSVGNHNLAEAEAVLDLLVDFGLDHVNIHYVSNRGFAGSDLPVGVASWLSLRERIAARERPPKVRFEGTFRPSGTRHSCAVRDRSMLMFFPDARVFSCSMYLGMENGHTHTWDGSALTNNDAFIDHEAIEHAGLSHCPAMMRVNPALCSEAEQHGRSIDCIFEKETLGVLDADHVNVSADRSRVEL